MACEKKDKQVRHAVRFANHDEGESERAREREQLAKLLFTY